MRTRVLSIVIIATIPVFGMGCSKQVSFKDDVNPILVSSCLACHVAGEGSSKSGFSVQGYNSVMKGTKFGPVIVPGDSESSTLYRLIGQKAQPEIQMPPHHNESLAEGRLAPLTPEQVETIRMWIDQGAKNN
ncbi:MAG: hypothetical protein KAJ65_01255 [Gammaproteobacteria bacterium]|nr:hypothetical protein [Gammaproteobacteria bacterium]